LTGSVGFATVSHGEKLLRIKDHAGERG